MWINLRQKAEQTMTADYVMAGGDMVSSPLVASIDPRVDIDMVNEQMIHPAEDAFDIDPDPDDEELDDSDTQADSTTDASSANTGHGPVEHKVFDDEDVDNEIGGR